MDDAKIITRLDGGLGNQMFQYAVGRSLSLRHNAPLYVDVGVYRSYTTRQYALGVFNVATEKMPVQNSPALLRSLPVQQAGRILGNLARRLPLFASSAINGFIARKNIAMLEGNVTHGFGTLCHEKQQFGFDGAISEIPPPLYLVGFWQNEKYFAGCQDTIRRDFTLRAPISATANAYVKAAEQPPSASLHIRRGDYVRSSASRRLNVCGMKYYRDALHIISTRVPKVRIFVFSDEIGWARANLRFERVTFVEGCRDFEEMFIMSRCTHNIIANSSFSWWGAWLNANAGKHVIAPQRWVNDDIGGRSPVPETWQRI